MGEKVVGFWGMGKVAEASAKRILAMHTFGGQKIAESVDGLGGLRLFTSPKQGVSLEERLDALRDEFIAVDGITQQDMDKVSMHYRGNVRDELDDVDVLFVTGDSKRVQSLDRWDIAVGNIQIINKLGTHLPSNFDGLIGIVSNLPEVLCFAANQNQDLRIPGDRIFGVTHVETDRAVEKIASMTGMNKTDIEAYMVGIHGDSLLYLINPKLDDKEKEAVETYVSQSSLNIVRSIGMSADSTSKAVYETLCAVYNRRTVVAAIPHRIHELGMTVYMSYPAVFGSQGVERDDHSWRLAGNVLKAEFLDKAENLAEQLVGMCNAGIIKGDYSIPARYKLRKRWDKARNFRGKRTVLLAAGALLLTGAGYMFIPPALDNHRVERAERSMIEMGDYIDQGDTLRAGIAYGEIKRIKAIPGVVEIQARADERYKNEIKPLEEAHFDHMKEKALRKIE